MPPTRWSHLLAIFGALVALTAVLLPQEWYDPLPQRESLPDVSGINGLVLLRASLVVEGLALVWLGLSGWRFSRLDEAHCLPTTPRADAAGALPLARAAWLLLGASTIGLSLRLFRLDSDLWLDEITPLVDYRGASVPQMVTSYISSNNHLLNSLLVKLVVALLGEREWTARLPAVLFGVATIPGLYWVARHALSRAASLAAALLLAVSYHHIFFSQNARGYTAYLLFSLLGAGLLLRGLRRDRARTWALYVLVMWLNFAANLIAAFVLAAHVLIVGAALLEVRRNGASPLPLGRRLLGVFAVTALLTFQLYAAALPQIYAYMKGVYTDPAAGYAPLSLDLLHELIRGVTVGFGPGLLPGLVPVVAIAAAGLLSLVGQCWPVALALLLPPVLHAAFIIARDLVASPRFFLLALPLALMAVARGIELLAGRLARVLRRPTFAGAVGTTLVLTAAIAAVIPLRGYYAVPKQPYRRSIQFVEGMRTADDVVIVVALAEHGYRYYEEQGAATAHKRYFFVRSLAALDRALAAMPDKRAILVTTFSRALRINTPELDARIRRGWRIAETFPGIVGDGAISVWLPITRGTAP